MKLLLSGVMLLVTAQSLASNVGENYTECLNSEPLLSAKVKELTIIQEHKIDLNKSYDINLVEELGNHYGEDVVVSFKFKDGNLYVPYNGVTEYYTNYYSGSVKLNYDIELLSSSNYLNSFRCDYSVSTDNTNQVSRAAIYFRAKDENCPVYSINLEQAELATQASFIFNTAGVHEFTVGDLADELGDSFTVVSKCEL